MEPDDVRVPVCHDLIQHGIASDLDFQMEPPVYHQGVPVSQTRDVLNIGFVLVDGARVRMQDLHVVLWNS